MHAANDKVEFSGKKYSRHLSAYTDKKIEIPAERLCWRNVPRDGSHMHFAMRLKCKLNFLIFFL